MSVVSKSIQLDARDFEFVKEIEDGIWLVVQPGDPRSETYLAQRISAFDDANLTIKGGGKLTITQNKILAFQTLLNEGSQGSAITQILNHENLVSLVGYTQKLPFVADPTKQTKQDFFVWDYCDAANLSCLFQVNPKTTTSERYYLPESLCWHVLTSLLCAVRFLHDGQRLMEPTEVNQHSEETYRKQNPSGLTLFQWQTTDTDWNPILHRSIEPVNIFFQHPRGIETYGLCKLGDMSMAVVTNHIRNKPIKRANRTRYNAAITNLEDQCPLQVSLDNLGSDPRTIPRNERPYTLMDEFWAIGQVIFTMMTATRLERCCSNCNSAHITRCKEGGCLRKQAVARGCTCTFGGCEHIPEGECQHNESEWPHTQTHCQAANINVDTLLTRARYTSHLRWAVQELLCFNRKGRSWGSAGPMEDKVRQRYMKWRVKTEEGQQYRDVYDDLMMRRWLEQERELAAMDWDTDRRANAAPAASQLPPNQRLPAATSTRPSTGDPFQLLRPTLSNILCINHFRLDNRRSTTTQRKTTSSSKHSGSSTRPYKAHTTSTTLSQAATSPAFPALASSRRRPVDLVITKSAIQPEKAAATSSKILDSTLLFGLTWLTRRAPSYTDLRMAALAAPTPPLLLTKRLNAFLHANQSPQTPSLLLTTAHGKLLAHASSQPVSILRTHATVAASLLAIHTASSSRLPSALPGSRTPDPVVSPPDSDNEDDSAHHGGSKQGIAHRVRSSRDQGGHGLVKPSTITVQLSGGTVVIRRLSCGLLFVCVGPSPATSSVSSSADQRSLLRSHENGDSNGSPSEAASFTSAGAQTTTSSDSASTASVAAIRRQAAALAHWLEDKLGTLQVPEEGVGVE